MKVRALGLISTQSVKNAGFVRKCGCAVLTPKEDLQGPLMACVGWCF